MPYTVYITETSYTSASFATKEEAEAFMEEPDYDLCRSWEMSESNIELVEDVTVWQLAQGGLRFPPKPVILHSYLRNPMVFVISKLNSCTYKLDANNQRVLMYAPLLSDGSYETAGSAYDWVEWDRLDPDVLEEADRIHKLLLADVTVWQVAQDP